MLCVVLGCAEVQLLQCLLRYVSLLYLLYVTVTQTTVL